MPHPPDQAKIHPSDWKYPILTTLRYGFPLPRLLLLWTLISFWDSQCHHPNPPQVAPIATKGGSVQ